MSHVDLAGIGAGPSNLSLAALASTLEQLRCRFFERQAGLRWHPGLMLADSLLQVSHLKDLVTLVDPTNPYTFLNFLACTGRLHRFAAMPSHTVTRREFEAYYQWAADTLPSVELGCAVEEVTFDGNAFRLATRRGVHTAQHLSVAVGQAPHVPDVALPHLGPTVFHSAEFVRRLDAVAGRAVVVVGGGQSGAEVVAHLLDLPAHRAVASLTWISRRPGFPQLDDSAFTNEWFQPDYVRHFHGLPPGRRRELLAVQQFASDGVSADLLERIYRRLYEIDFLDEVRLPYVLLPSRVLGGLERDAGASWRLTLAHADTGAREIVHGDLVILATGYRFGLTECLRPLAERIPQNPGGELPLAGDYSVPWDGPARNKLFFLNAGRVSHGIADPNLSLASWRAAEVLRSLTTVPYNVAGRSSTNQWAGLASALPAAAPPAQPPLGIESLST